MAQNIFGLLTCRENFNGLGTLKTVNILYCKTCVGYGVTLKLKLK